jgi:hypothetical protein
LPPDQPALKWLSFVYSLLMPLIYMIICSYCRLIIFDCQVSVEKKKKKHMGRPERALIANMEWILIFLTLAGCDRWRSALP